MRRPVVNTYVPLKKLSISEVKLLSKPWITYGIMTSRKSKDKVYEKLLKTKNSQQKGYTTNSKDKEIA